MTLEGCLFDPAYWIGNELGADLWKNPNGAFMNNGSFWDYHSRQLVALCWNTQNVAHIWEEVGFDAWEQQKESWRRPSEKLATVKSCWRHRCRRRKKKSPLKLADEHVDKAFGRKKRWLDETTVALSGYNVKVQRNAILTVLLLVELGSCTKSLCDVYIIFFFAEPEIISWTVETWTRLGVPPRQWLRTRIKSRLWIKRVNVELKTSPDLKPYQNYVVWA